MPASPTLRGPWAYYSMGTIPSRIAVCCVELAFNTPTLAQTLTIPSWSPYLPRQCEPTLITWQGGRPPYRLAILTKGIKALPVQYEIIDARSFIWNTTLSAGTAITFTIMDSANDTASALNNVSVQSSEDDGCLSSSVATLSENRLSIRQTRDDWELGAGRGNSTGSLGGFPFPGASE
ncbi:hypothetical protein C8Q80DRAFT_1117854 [Daedaleopsis nitida]|nr:hypothetical protein C8Q80DRAFT_1117854 [Daedaleopsis nitida]